MSDLLIRREGSLGHVTLNRPKALNAITREMVGSIHAALDAWAEDAAIQAVLIDGAGERGLCAGGDISAIYEATLSGSDAPAHFWREEYGVNALIARYPKPYVAIMDGIVMGGGVGMSAHGSHRIVTERSRIAMPEVGIGFVPDVGGTYLLSRAPGELGTYVGLTASPMNAADAILCGFADLCAPSTQSPALIESLRHASTAVEVETALQSIHVDAGPSRLAAQRDWIDACFCYDTIEEILAALEAHQVEDARTTATLIRRHSPTSLKITLRALREARALPNLERCLELEYRVAVATLANPDLREGIRAAVIDKGTPQWSPARIEDVTDEMVARHFRAPSSGDLHLGP